MGIIGDTAGSASRGDRKSIVRIYSKPGCHLCEELLSALEQYANERSFGIAVSNIEEDAALFEQFGKLIPVVEFADGALLYPPHDIAHLQLRIEALTESNKFINE